MQPAGSPSAPKPRMILLALSVALALIGTIGAATGAADKDSDDLKTAGASTTTTVRDENTTTSLGTADSTAATTVTTAKPGTTATTAKGGTSATTAKPGACEHQTSSTPPAGAHTPPALGKYIYVDCESGEQVTRTVTAGASAGGVTRRVIQNSVGGFEMFATTAFSGNGVVQEKAEIHAMGQVIQCDWNPDIVEYPQNLAVGTTWSASSSCTLGGLAQLKLTGTRKITGIATFVVGDTPVTAWIVDDNQTVTTTYQGKQSSVTNKGFHLYDPVHGMVVYEKATVSGSGATAVPETTVEGRLTSLTPATS